MALSQVVLGAGVTSQTSLLFVTAIVLVSSLILGGGTRPGFLGDVLLQLIAVPVLLLLVSTIFPAKNPATQPFAPAGLEGAQLRSARWAAAACALVCLWPLLQLVPLPPALWTRLPDREHLARSYELLSEPLPWRPVSMAPQATWAGWLSLIPAAAVFLGTALLGHQARRRQSLVLLAIGLFSVALGLLQVAQGPASSLRFFEFTNTLDAVGFFANRNHFAALLYCLTVFAVVWTIDCAVVSKARDRSLTPAVLTLIAAFTVIVVLIGAQAMARSRAGIALSIAALASAFLLVMADRRAKATSAALRLIIASVALGMTFAMQFALYRVMERFTSDPLADGRLIFTPRTYAIAKEHLLAGSGIGTFVPVYALHERTEDLLANTFVNHAHNDIVQLLLEAGAAGGILMFAAIAWLAYQIFQCWRPAPPDASDLDRGLKRAATIVVLLLAAHSFVDYPLRTGAMLAIMAFALGLLVEPPAGANPPEPGGSAEVPAARTQSKSSRSRRKSVMGGPAGSQPAPADYQWPAQAQAQGEPGEGVVVAPNVNWPQEWAQRPDTGPAEPRRPVAWPTKPGKPGKPDDPQA